MPAAVAGPARDQEKDQASGQGDRALSSAFSFEEKRRRERNVPLRMVGVVARSCREPPRLETACAYEQQVGDLLDHRERIGDTDGVIDFRAQLPMEPLSLL